ncbi:MAG: PEP-CTERM sorting domain-containing protein [Burkholderiales bacterium]|nr:PEP-CTERM sorting domain-containing protein [Burkholderiales bacterium]
MASAEEAITPEDIYDIYQAAQAPQSLSCTGLFEDCFLFGDMQNAIKAISYGSAPLDSTATWLYQLSSGAEDDYVAAWITSDAPNADLLVLHYIVQSGEGGSGKIVADPVAVYPYWAVNSGYSKLPFSEVGLAATQIPEPGVLGLLGLAFAGIGLAARRRRS